MGNAKKIPVVDQVTLILKQDGPRTPGFGGYAGDASELPQAMRALVSHSPDPNAVASGSCLEVAWLFKKERARKPSLPIQLRPRHRLVAVQTGRVATHHEHFPVEQ